MLLLTLLAGWEGVDRCAIKVGYVSDVDVLASRLEECGRTEMEKARAIYRWITRYISYEKIRRSWDWRTVLKNRKGVCAGYSSLAGVLAEKMGLDYFIVSNEIHAWITIKANGRWIVMDPTWGAGVYRNGKFRRRFEPAYFDMDPKLQIFIPSHYPLSLSKVKPDFQFILGLGVDSLSEDSLRVLASKGLAPDIWEWRTYEGVYVSPNMADRVPQFSMAFFKEGFRVYNLKRMIESKEAMFEYRMFVKGPRGKGICARMLKEDVFSEMDYDAEGCYEMKDTLMNVFANVKYEGDTALYEIIFRFEEEGPHVIFLFIEGGNGKIYEVMDDHRVKALLPFDTTLGNLWFPWVSMNFYKFGGRDLKPTSGNLISNRSYRFSLRIDMDSLLIISKGDTVRMEREGNLWFGKSFPKGGIVKIIGYKGRREYDLVGYMAYSSSPVE